MKNNQTKPTLTLRFSVLLALSQLLAAVLLAFGASGAELRAVRDQGYLNLSWDAIDGKLQEASTPNGPWQTVTTITNPCYRAQPVSARKFYRLVQPAPGKKWLTVATVAMTAKTNTAANLQTFFSYMEQAASNHADLVVFPEVALQQCPAWGQDSYIPTPQEMAYVQQTAETIPGESTSNLVAKAKTLNLFVVFGMTEKDAGNLLYDTSVFLGPDGVIGKHRKTYLVWNESKIWRSSTGFQVFNSPIGRIGQMICAEMYSGGVYPGPGLASQGADLLVTSSLWPYDYPSGYDLVTVQNAVRSSRWHVVSDGVGLVGHYPVYGHSRVIDPRGTIVCETGANEGFVVWATDILIEARTP